MSGMHYVRHARVSISLQSVNNTIPLFTSNDEGVAVYEPIKFFYKLCKSPHLLNQGKKAYGQLLMGMKTKRNPVSEM